MPNTITPIIIGRPINGITINGLEYLLDDNDQPIEFPTVEEAKAFLTEHGFSEEQLEGFVFENL